MNSDFYYSWTTADCEYSYVYFCLLLSINLLRQATNVSCLTIWNPNWSFLSLLRIQVTNAASTYMQQKSTILYLSLKVPFVKLMFSNLFLHTFLTCARRSATFSYFQQESSAVFWCLHWNSFNLPNQAYITGFFWNVISPFICCDLFPQKRFSYSSTGLCAMWTENDNTVT